MMMSCSDHEDHVVVGDLAEKDDDEMMMMMMMMRRMMMQWRR